jgi:hypothetical protein
MSTKYFANRDVSSAAEVGANIPPRIIKSLYKDGFFGLHLCLF